MPPKQACSRRRKPECAKPCKWTVGQGCRVGVPSPTKLMSRISWTINESPRKAAVLEGRSGDVRPLSKVERELVVIREPTTIVVPLGRDVRSSQISMQAGATLADLLSAIHKHYRKPRKISEFEPLSDPFGLVADAIADVRKKKRRGFVHVMGDERFFEGFRIKARKWILRLGS